MIAALIITSVLLANPCVGSEPLSDILDVVKVQEPPVYGYKVLSELAHDPKAFTQGLLFHDGALYESTGLVGHSTIRRIDLDTGRATTIKKVDAKLFAEGLSLDKNGRLVQLTWQSGDVLTWDAKTLKPVGKTRKIQTEGWGLTFDGTHLVQSDGSSKIYIRNPDTLEIDRTIDVTANGTPVPMLNELEYVDGEIWANVWMTDRIARISPKTGEVTGWIDLTGLRKSLGIPDGEQYRVLNGIAWDAATKRLWVGGKQWPKIFQIELTPDSS